MKHYESSEAKCPFYRGEEERRIYCEGAEEGVYTQVTFEKYSKAKEFKRDYCRAKFTSCPYCRMLFSKYEK